MDEDEGGAEGRIQGSRSWRGCSIGLLAALVILDGRHITQNTTCDLGLLPFTLLLIEEGIRSLTEGI